MSPPRVVIVGAGFGGLECARSLAGKPVEVLLLDRNNYHLFTPLLYQVASSLLNPSDIAYPVRKALRGAPNLRFRLAEVAGADLAARSVRTADGVAIPYDFLVLATGSTSNFFGLREVEARAHGLKDLPEALELRNHILRCFEAAAGNPGEPARRHWLTFVIVGGGPTGVEYAGALSELVRLVLARDFPELDLGHRPGGGPPPRRRHHPDGPLGEVRVFLVEALGQVLPQFSEKLGRDAREHLERRGVSVRLGARVVGYDGDAVRLSTGEVIEARTLVWAAGVKPAGLASALDLPRTRSGRIETDEFLRVRGQERVFAIGDVAAVSWDGREIPMLAPPAQQEARHVARNILRLALGRPPLPFRYRDPGIMATIGRNAAVAQIGRLALRGFAGWITWLFLHLYLLIGFRNRLMVLLGWAWDYLRYDRPVRIIARAREEPPPPGGVRS